MSRATVLADAIKDDLNGASFSQAFTAVRKYKALYTLKDMKTLRVTVVLSLIDQTSLSRYNNLDSITIGLVVQKQVDHSDNTETDAMSSLLEEISEHFRDKTYGNANWLGNTITIPFDSDDLTEERVFTGVVMLRYQVAWVKE